MSQCIIKPIKGGNLAYITLIGKQLEIGVHEIALNTMSDTVFNVIMLHELRHIPQMIICKKIADSIVFPENIQQNHTKEYLIKLAINSGMDIALHEDIKKLLGGGIIQKMSGAIKQVMLSNGDEVDDNKTYGCWLETVREMIPEAEAEQDFGYYTQLLIDHIVKNNQQQLQWLENLSFDDHDIDFSQFDPDILSFIVSKAHREGRIISNKMGTNSSDEDVFIGSTFVSERIKQAIKKIKVALTRCADGKASRRMTFERINKMWDSMPGNRQSTEKTAGVFFIGDTSGSMLSPHISGQLIPALNELKKKHIIAGAYACDTELYPFGSYTKGGGGTTLEDKHIDQIRSVHNLKQNQKIDIVYVTDGDAFYSLERSMSHINLHVIKVDLS
jgi:hypothetical protein